MKYSIAATLAILSTTASLVSGQCTLYANKIKIQSTTGKPLSMREVRVFSGTNNVAIGKTATQSSDLNEDSGASEAVDGNWRTKATTNTTECAMWWEVDLEARTAINKVVMVNPNKGCDLSHATISLLNGDGEYTAAKIVGNTCDKGWVVRKFEIECPPTSAPTGVSCGGTRTAMTCGQCSSVKDANCAGDCGWVINTGVCGSKATTVNCGAHRATNCGQCPFDFASGGKNMGQHWCNGECNWAEPYCVGP
eukprot:scaffold70358_cov69-Cyclotella_meneghiniana.AAC.2